MSLEGAIKFEKFLKCVRDILGKPVMPQIPLQTTTILTNGQRGDGDFERCVSY